MASNAQEIDANPAAWCAIELAILDALATGRQPDGGASALAARARRESFTTRPCSETHRRRHSKRPPIRYRRFGFSDFKLKLSGDLERDRAKMAVMRGLDARSRSGCASTRTICGATPDEAIGFLRSLDYPFFAIEEPLGPNQYDQLARVSDALGCPIILDESLLRVEQLAALPDPPARWIINVRVSKMGGLLRSLRACRCGAPLGARHHRRRAGRGNEPAHARGADRRERGRRRARRAGRRVRHQTARARRLRSAADVRTRAACSILPLFRRCAAPGSGSSTGSRIGLRK